MEGVSYRRTHAKKGAWQPRAGQGVKACFFLGRGHGKMFHVEHVNVNASPSHNMSYENTASYGVGEGVVGGTWVAATSMTGLAAGDSGDPAPW